MNATGIYHSTESKEANRYLALDLHQLCIRVVNVLVMGLAVVEAMRMVDS